MYVDLVASNHGIIQMIYTKVSLLPVNKIGGSKMNNEAMSPPLKWHKFLIYFTLWVGAASSALTGLTLIAGSQYENAASVYASVPGLKFIDISFGILDLITAVFFIYTRFQLARFKKGAPYKLFLLFAVTAFLPLLYPLAVSAHTKIPLTNLVNGSPAANFLGTMIGTGVSIFLMSIYYKKRSHLFTN